VSEQAPSGAHPGTVANTLDDASIHLWWLPWQRGQGRSPLLGLLAAYLAIPPAEVRLESGAHGRPALAAPAAALDFNWSHSANRAVVALARRLPRLGVDVEYPRAGRDCLALARRFFSLPEYEQLEQLAPTARQRAFVQLWTAKEAVLKAHGRGLAYGLDRVTFTLAGASVRARQFAGPVGRADTWQLRHWPLPDAAWATLAWQGGAREVRHFTPASPELFAPGTVPRSVGSPQP
jgi:4'-phosphopantetheinyl transferase